MADSLLSRARSLLPARQSRGATSIETNGVEINSESLLQIFGINSNGEVRITVEKALQVPAVWNAVNFLSGTLAGLPLPAYQKKTNGDPEKIGGAVHALMNYAANDEMSAHQLRRWCFDRLFSRGRCFAWIERDQRGNPVNLHPMHYDRMKVQRVGGVKKYVYQQTETGVITYDAADVIDIAFMGTEDGLGHYSPFLSCANAIATAISAQLYGSKLFKNGGMPAFFIEGPFQSAQGIRSAEENLANATAEAFQSGKLALALPGGHTVKQLAIDPAKLQMVDFRRFLIEEVARIYSLPPVFLQDLTHGTFSNTEQQDLHLTKHVILRWTAQIEAELNLKLFGRDNGRKRTMKYFEHNVDGLLRGDFKTRMDGISTGVQNGILTPNEARKLDNRPALTGGDDLMIQGATVPLKNQKDAAPGKTNPAPSPAPVAAPKSK